MEKEYKQSFIVFGKYIWLILFLPFIVFAWPWILKTYLLYKTTRITTTNKGIIVKGGILRRISQEIPYRNVNSIVVYQSFLGRLLNYGNIAIFSGNSIIWEKFRYITDPNDFKSSVEDHLK